MLRPAAHRGVCDSPQLVIDRHNEFINDPAGGKSHTANAGLHRHVREETRKEADMSVADVANRGPDKFRARPDLDIPNDGCHNLESGCDYKRVMSMVRSRRRPRSSQ